MTMPMANPSIAILVANGFAEDHITAVQRAMTKQGKTYKIIAPEQGLANGWQNNAWGHYFTVDESISTAMGSDYDMLILIGGERGTAKLKTNLHTRRIVNHFLEAQKPVAAIESGIELLALSPKSAGLSVAKASLSQVQEAVKAAGMEISDQPMLKDGVVLTSNGEDVEAWVEAVMSLTESCQADEADAQAA